MYQSDTACGSCFISGLDKRVVKVPLERGLKFEPELCIR